PVARGGTRGHSPTRGALAGWERHPGRHRRVPATRRTALDALVPGRGLSARGAPGLRVARLGAARVGGRVRRAAHNARFRSAVESIAAGAWQGGAADLAAA